MAKTLLNSKNSNTTGDADTCQALCLHRRGKDKKECGKTKENRK